MFGIQVTPSLPGFIASFERTWAF